MSSLLSILTLLFIVIVVGFSQAEETLISSQPQQKDSNDNCSYHLNIETSCFSPSHTRDHISLVFGDKYGHEVYVPRLDEFPSATLGRCTLSFVDFTGPCTSQICYLYFYRIGSDGYSSHAITVSGNFSEPAVFFQYFDS
ncbi:hypothetical protein K1719_021516 [Acacia pycnantha]|nr:hypothetical protein K1719_021516 [Acacia pycnantha]